MSTEHPAATPEPGPDAGIEEIQADIDQTRKELGETVEALAAKVDVTGRAKQKASDTKDRVVEKAQLGRDVIVEKARAVQTTARAAVTDDVGSVKPVVPVAAVVAVTAVIGFVWWRRRR